MPSVSDPRIDRRRRHRPFTRIRKGGVYKCYRQISLGVERPGMTGKAVIAARSVWKDSANDSLVDTYCAEDRKISRKVPSLGTDS